MAEVVASSLFCQELTIRIMCAFRNNDGAVAMFFNFCINGCNKFFLIEFNFREKCDNRNAIVFNQCTSSCDPASMTAHNFDNEDFSWCGSHWTYIERCFQCRNGNVFCYWAKTRAVISDRKVVINCFWYVDGLNRETHFFRKLRNLVTSISRVSATVVKKVTNVVSLEDFDQAFVFTLVVFQAFQFETTRTETTRRCFLQRSNVFIRFFWSIDQLLG